MTSVLHLLTSPAAAAVRFLPLLADAAIKGVLVFGAAAVAVALCRRRSAATRHAIWAGAVVAQLALPGLSALLPAWRTPLVERLDRRFGVMRVATAEPADVAAFVAPDVADEAVEPDPVEMPAPAMAPELYSADHVSAIAEGARARVEARIARAEARMARAEARMARAEARAEARAARGQAIGVAVGSSFGEGRSYGAHVIAWQAPRAGPFTRAARFLRGVGASSWIRVAAVVWLLGALAILARFMAGTLAVSRLARRSDRVEDGRWLSLAQRIAGRLGVARPMTLLRSGRFEIPVTWGIVYPVVLLPDNADEWTDDRRRYVLVHEMAHVKRVDAFTQLIAQLTLAAFWVNPFVWIAAHRMRVEREHACDDYVLREGTPASTYAADLLAMVRSLGSPGQSAQPAFAALAMARPDELEARMDAILDPAQDRRTLAPTPALGLALCSLLLLIPLAAFRPFATREKPSFAMNFPPAPAGFVVSVPDDLYARVVSVPSIPSIPTLPTMPVIPPDLEATLHQTAIALQAARAPLAALSTHAAALAAVSAAARTAPLPPTMTAALATTRTASWSSVSGESCSSVSLRRSGSSVSVHSSSDDDDSSFQYISSSNGRCLQVAVWGAVEFSPDDREIAHLSRDGRLYVRERRSDVDRELTVTPGDDENPRYAYSVDGERASYEEGGREWLAELLPEVIRESGLNARQRVARLRRDGGVSAVLADIKSIQSTSAKRAAYEALLKEGNLSSEDEARIARQAGSDLASSDGELRSVLAQMGNHGRLGPGMAEALGAATERMTSDGEKRALLQQYALQGDRDMLLVAIQRARSITSDGEKAGFLRATASRYLANDDESLRNAFFSVTQSISSDGEKRGVLNEALPYASRPALLLSMLDVTRTITSDGEKSEILVSMLRRRCITTPQLREAFMRTTRTLTSDAEYRRVMEAMLES